MFSKALADFDTDPTGTKFMFVLPKWESSNWWHFTKYFELIKEYPTGSKIFTAPKHGTYRTEELEEAGEEGGEDRVFIQGTKWPVCIFYKDVHTVTTITDNLLFHLRMGHPGKAVVEHVINHNIKTGLKLDKDSIEPAHCSACKIAKATKPVVYPTTLDHQYELFEFILSDIHGPVAPTSTEGYRYIIAFTCYTSRYSKPYFLKTRDEALDAFILFISDVTQMGFTIKQIVMIRTDNALEYVAGQFASFCKEQGIIQQKTAPYMHTNMAIGERLWRTILNIQRALFVTSDLPQEYWPLTARHSFYIYVRRAHRFLDMAMSPHQKVFRMPPDLSKLRVFGCPAYAFVDPTLRGKLNDRAIEGNYVGQEEHSSAYLIMDKNGKVHRSGQVSFVENYTDLGKSISDHKLKPEHFTDQLDMEHDWSSPPPNFQQDESINDIKRITNHSIYYSTEDQETYGIIKAITQEHPEGAWFHFRALFHSDTPSQAPKMWEKYLRDKVVANSTVNKFYPIFTKVAVRTDRRHSQPLQAYIVSTDTNYKSGKSYPYGVGFVDQAHEAQDVEKWQVAFPEIAMAATTSASSSPESKANYLIDFNNYQEPRSYRHALTFPDSAAWIAATWEEVNSIINFGVIEPCELKDIPADANIVDTKLVYKLKRNADGSIDKRKARLVARGFTQEYGKDYVDTFAPVSDLLTIRLVLLLALIFSLIVKHVDVKCAFLNSVLSYDIYLKLPNGFNIGGMQYGKAKKSIYGLKQAAHDWHQLQHKFIMSFDKRLQRSSVDPCLYYIFITGGLIAFISTHVDDYVIATNDINYIQRLLHCLRSPLRGRGAGSSHQPPANGHRVH